MKYLILYREPDQGNHLIPKEKIWIFTGLSAASATLAQLVEQRIRNAQVVGSNPTGGSLKYKMFYLIS